MVLGVGEEGEGVGLHLLAGTRGVVAVLGSQLLVVEEEVEEQQNQGEVGKMRVGVGEGCLETQSPQVVEEM